MSNVDGAAVVRTFSSFFDCITELFDFLCSSVFSNGADYSICFPTSFSNIKSELRELSDVTCFANAVSCSICSFTDLVCFDIFLGGTSSSSVVNRCAGVFKLLPLREVLDALFASLFSVPFLFIKCDMVMKTH